MRVPPGLAALAITGVVLSTPLAAAPVAAAPMAAVAYRGAALASAPSGILAKGAGLVDAGTGRELWGRSINTVRPMGSITKVMTALVVIRDGNLGQKITIPAAAVAYVHRYGASSAGLRPGDTLTASALLDALLLPSGCDAAYVLAAAYGHGWTAFVAQMNATAKRLGLAHTHFANFDGLPWPAATSTYSTPADLIALGRAAMALAPFRAVVDQRAYHLAARPARSRLTNLASTPYINTPTGKQNQKVSLYYDPVPLQQGKTVRYLTLPAFSQGAVSGSTAMHVFAVSIG